VKLSDTDPKVARLQLELLRQAGPNRCLNLGLKLSDEVMRASRRAFIKRYGDEQRALVEWVRTFYGPELAKALEKRAHAV
jgi:hypothetical protein